MEQIYSEVVRKVLDEKKLIENSFKVKISNKGKILFVEGDPEQEMLALSSIEAINLGFSVTEACLLKEENIVFEKINIKTESSRKNLEEIRARIIGEKRKALNTIENLTDCLIVVHDNTVGIIGRIEDIEKAVYAIKRIISGSKHATVYNYLEEQKAAERNML